MGEPVELVVYQGRGEEHREPTVEEVIEYGKAHGAFTYEFWRQLAVDEGYFGELNDEMDSVDDG